jgi:N-acyl-D-aspartate/D-glutamate deacylase
VIAGNCGFTLAPSHDVDRDLITRTLQAVEDMSLATLEAGVVWDFTSFGDYLELIERRGVGLNFGCYVGHSATRIFVMGDEAHERHATEDEIAQMRHHVRESIAAGAIGLSSSYSISHRLDGQRPVASRASTAQEFVALASVLGELGRGVVIVAPGFIDVHTHYDAQVFWDPMFSSSCYHGVTSVIAGNCGFTLAPAKPADVDWLAGMLSRVEGMSLESLQLGPAWDWNTTADYLDRLENRIGINAGFLIGHSTLRAASATDAPADASRTAIAAPMPRLAPVTSAILP